MNKNTKKKMHEGIQTARGHTDGHLGESHRRLVRWLVRRWGGSCGRAACYDTRRVSVCYNTAGATLGWVLSVGLCWFALGLCYHIWTDGKMVRDFREWV